MRCVPCGYIPRPKRQHQQMPTVYHKRYPLQRSEQKARRGKRTVGPHLPQRPVPRRGRRSRRKMSLQRQPQTVQWNLHTMRRRILSRQGRRQTCNHSQHHLRRVRMLRVPSAQLRPLRHWRRKLQRNAKARTSVSIRVRRRTPKDAPHVQQGNIRSTKQHMLKVPEVPAHQRTQRVRRRHWVHSMQLHHSCMPRIWRLVLFHRKVRSGRLRVQATSYLGRTTARTGS